MADQNAKVLICGAGISGLALAQGLKKAGIPFHVFECDPTPAFRPQGYRFRVSNDSGAAALREVLTDELFRRFEKVCAVTVLGGTSIDAANGEVASAPLGPRPSGGPGMKPGE
jgi:2-polyprenyl-6-methoxyphenol hydroxylase-like FAD-dependent oxidoreductase